MKNILKAAIIARLSFFPGPASAQHAADRISDTSGVTSIKIHFLHGSKSAKCCRKTEGKWFGGIHGGHVYMQLGNELMSFYPLNNWHIFSKKKDIGGAYVTEPAGQ